MDAEGARLARALSRPSLPPTMERWRLAIAPDQRLDAHEADWAGALVLVERGDLGVECRGGRSERFDAGSVVALGWLPLHRLTCLGSEAVELLAVRRRRAAGAESATETSRRG